ncbi:hypothetical protein ACTVZO_02500 [Streptomyces sp. IBSNAI002]|uniref:hypothetical protein n=1 Tax=Streptomyces sp. IBSNAI002 TaxID=3457500 RepID=UPI003FD13576
MSTRVRVATAVAAGMLAAVGMAAPAAAATPPADRPITQSTASDAGVNQVVTTWTSANVRTCASTNCDIAYSVDANTGLNASCWSHGQWVNQNGVAHDKWVRLYSGNWIWGGLLKGNETGGVSTRC